MDTSSIAAPSSLSSFISPRELRACISRPDAPPILGVRPTLCFSAATRILAGAQWRAAESIDDVIASTPAPGALAGYCADGHKLGRHAVALMSLDGPSETPTCTFETITGVAA